MNQHADSVLDVERGPTVEQEPEANGSATGNDAISIDAVSEETQRETQPESEGAATADEEESTGVTVEIPDSVSENGDNAAPAPGIVAPTLIV